MPDTTPVTDLPASVAGLVRGALTSYPGDPDHADFILQYACSQLADPLPLYRVLYKLYNRQRRFDLAEDFAARALAGAAQRCALPADPATWTRAGLAAVGPAAAGPALLALKALAFISLRRGDAAAARRHLAILARLDPEDGSGASVVTALADSIDGTARYQHEGRGRFHGDDGEDDD